MVLLKFSNLIHLYRVRLRARWVQELLAVLGIAIGVALLFAASVANTSLIGSVTQLQSGLVGDARVQLVARGPAGFNERLLRKVQDTPGVRSAAPVLETYATVTGPKGERPVVLVGADPRFARLGGPLLRRFTATELAEQEALALPAPIAAQVGSGFGQRVTLDIAGVRHVAPIGAQLSSDDIGSLVNNPIALAPLAYAQQLAGMRGRVTRIFVVSDPGRDAEVEAALGRLAGDGVNVRAGDFDVSLFRQAAAPTSQSTALFSAFSALVGFLFAFSAMLLTVPQRRRLIVDMRLAGHDAPVVIQVLLFDALVLGGAAAVLGLAIGDLLSRHLFHDVPGYLAAAFPVGAQRVVTWQSFALAIGGGLLAAGVAVLSPLREIFSRRPVLGETTPTKWRHERLWLVAGGAVCLAVTTAILEFAPAAALVGMLTLTVAMLLLLPLVLDGAAALVVPARRRIKSAVPFLALTELRARSTRARALAVAATGAVAVFGSVGIQGAHGDLQRGLDHATRDLNAIADVWASPSGYPNLFATTPFAAGAERELAALPGVRSVRLYRSAFLDYGDRRIWVLAPPREASAPIPRSQLLRGNYDEATRRIREGGWAVVADVLAKQHGLRIGEDFTLPSPRPTRFRVAAISTNIGWPTGAVIVNAEDFARAWGSAEPSAYHLLLAPGASPAAVRADVLKVLGRQSGFAVETERQRVARHRAASRQGLQRLTQIAFLVLAAAVLAMSAAMGGMIWQRRARLARLKVDGMTERELWLAMLLESVVLLGAGCLTGAVFGLYGQVLLSRALSAVTGFPVVYEVAVAVAITSLVIVTAVAVAMVALPGFLAARVRPAVGLQD
jgi:putative ABC transport system permease protein